MNKVGWWRVLLWIGIALLPGAMILLPLVVVLLGRRRTAAEPLPVAPEALNSVPAPLELTELAPTSSRAIQLANA